MHRTKRGQNAGKTPDEKRANGRPKGGQWEAQGAPKGGQWDCQHLSVNQQSSEITKKMGMPKINQTSPPRIPSESDHQIEIRDQIPSPQEYEVPLKNNQYYRPARCSRAGAILLGRMELSAHRPTAPKSVF